MPSCQSPQISVEIPTSRARTQPMAFRGPIVMAFRAIFHTFYRPVPFQTAVSAVTKAPTLSIIMVHRRSFRSIPTRPGRNPNFRISQFCPQKPFFGIPRCRFLTIFDQNSPPAQPKNMISQNQRNVVLTLFVMLYIVIEEFHRPHRAMCEPFSTKNPRPPNLKI